MKRQRSGEEWLEGEAIDREESIDDMASCLMLLSKVGSNVAGSEFHRRVFTCKTCNREFPSFQALGGHRASHKKLGMGNDPSAETAPSTKPKSHACSICGLEFPLGQALGGHMRRHRGKHPAGVAPVRLQGVSVLKKSASSKRVTTFGLNLDLNLSPLENHLMFMLRGKDEADPPISIFI